MSNYLHHLNWIKVFPSTGEYISLKEASILMLALWQHLLSQLRVCGLISVETLIQRCDVLKQCGFKSSIGVSLKTGIPFRVQGVTQSEKDEM